MLLLKQSTAVILKLGPFVDDTDGVSAKTGLTIGQADIQISKNGGAFAQTSEGTPTTTHDADGWYPIPLTATDTNTLGVITVQVAMAGALPVCATAMVLPANVYDSLVGGSDYLDVNAAQAAATAALNAYDPPTKAELDTAVTTLRGADSDTLKTLSDQMDTLVPGSPVNLQIGGQEISIT